MSTLTQRLHDSTQELTGLLRRKAELYEQLDRGYQLLALFPKARSPFVIRKFQSRCIIECNKTGKEYYNMDYKDMTAEQRAAILNK